MIASVRSKAVAIEQTKDEPLLIADFRLWYEITGLDPLNLFSKKND